MHQIQINNILITGFSDAYLPTPHDAIITAGDIVATLCTSGYSVCSIVISKRDGPNELLTTIGKFERGGDQIQTDTGEVRAYASGGITWDVPDIMAVYMDDETELIHLDFSLRAVQERSRQKQEQSEET